MKHFTWRMRALFLIALLVVACSQPLSATQVPSDSATATKAPTPVVVATVGGIEIPDD